VESNEVKGILDPAKNQKPFKEAMPRGTVIFPLQYNFCNTVNPYYDLPLHWHDEFEIIHVLSGTYNMYFSDHEIKLNKGDICIIPGKIIHGDGPTKSQCLFESVVFDIDLIRQHSYSPDLFITDILNNNLYLNTIITKEHKEINDAICRFFELIKLKSEGYELMVSGYLLIIFGLIKKEYLYTRKQVLTNHKKARAEQLEGVLNMIRQNYSQNLTLEEMADYAGLSPKYFCRLFKDMTEHTPVEYLNWFRISRACTMLRETDDKLSEIAYNCGFNDFSYFIKIFRRYKGMTPYKYRTYDPAKVIPIDLDMTPKELIKERLTSEEKALREEQKMKIS